MVREEASETAPSQLLATVVGLCDLGICGDREGGITTGEKRIRGSIDGKDSCGFSLTIHWDGVDSGEGEDDQDGSEDGGSLELHVELFFWEGLRRLRKKRSL